MQDINQVTQLLLFKLIGNLGINVKINKNNVTLNKNKVIIQ